MLVCVLCGKVLKECCDIFHEVVDEEGNDICVYHARKESKMEGDPLYNPNRHAMLMKVEWDENGRPCFRYK